MVWSLSFQNFYYIFACISVYTEVHVCTCMWRLENSLAHHSSGDIHLSFSHWSGTHQVARLPGQRAPRMSLFPTAGVTRACCHAWLLMWVLGTEFRSFTNWGISSAPMIIFFLAHFGLNEVSCIGSSTWTPGPSYWHCLWRFVQLLEWRKHITA